MTNEEFRYWINGYLTLTSDHELTPAQINTIMSHANLVQAISGYLDEANSQFLSQLKGKSSFSMALLKPY